MIPLASMVKRAGLRRSKVTLRPVNLPRLLASDLAAIYKPVTDAWAAALPTLEQQYARNLSAMTTDAPDDLAATISGVESDLASVFLSVRLRLERWAAKVEAAHRRKWAAAIEAGAKVDISTMIGPADVRRTLGATIEANVSLVRSVSDEARRKIGDAVFRGFQRKAPAREIAAAMAGAVAGQRKRSLRIAAHQTTWLGSQLNDERRRQAGIDTWEWVSSHKVNFRPEHQERDGRVYSDSDRPSDLPGELPNCGCTSRAVLDVDAMIAAELERMAA